MARHALPTRHTSPGRAPRPIRQLLWMAVFGSVSVGVSVAGAQQSGKQSESTAPRSTPTLSRMLPRWRPVVAPTTPVNLEGNTHFVLQDDQPQPNATSSLTAQEPSQQTDRPAAGDSLIDVPIPVPHTSPVPDSQIPPVPTPVSPDSNPTTGPQPLNRGRIGEPRQADSLSDATSKAERVSVTTAAPIRLSRPVEQTAPLAAGVKPSAVKAAEFRLTDSPQLHVADDTAAENQQPAGQRHVRVPSLIGGTGSTASVIPSRSAIKRAAPIQPSIKSGSDQSTQGGASPGATPGRSEPKPTFANSTKPVAVKARSQGQRDVAANRPLPSPSDLPHDGSSEEQKGKVQPASPPATLHLQEGPASSFVNRPPTGRASRVRPVEKDQTVKPKNDAVQDETVKPGTPAVSESPLQLTKVDEPRIAAKEKARHTAPPTFPPPSFANYKIRESGGQLSVQVDQLGRIRSNDTPLEAVAEDESICRVVLAGGQLVIAGQRPGETRVAVLYQDASGATSCTIHNVTVTPDPTSVRLQKLASDINIALDARFPDCDISVTVTGRSLVIAGHASTEQQAWEAVRYVRSTAIVPVIDKIRIRTTH